MKAALENGITGGFLSHILLICGETEMAIASAKKHCVSVSVCGEAVAVLSVKSRLIEEFE